VSTAVAIREQHGRDESHHEPVAPDAVVFARSTMEISKIIKVCAEFGVPVIPFGAGTSLEGHIAALHGGISLDVTQMNRILRVSTADLDCTVEAGVTRKRLDGYLRDTGLFFPIDPGADASLGGMAATRASGTNAVRYGTMRENVLSLTVVLADGRVIRTARRARKSAAGYDLTRLFVGSEGTLGVITEITLRLYGIPEAVLSAVCSFPSIEAAVNTVITAIQAGVPMARIELLDDICMAAANSYSRLSYPVAPTLFFEFHGTQQGVEEQVTQLKEFARENEGTEFLWAVTSEERNRLWQARHNLMYAVMARRPSARVWSTDVCVPISRLAECIAKSAQDIKAASLIAGITGHVGDGNFHIGYLIDPSKPEEIAEAARLNERLVARAIEMDGTCTGEHGVGYGKIDFLLAEHGEAMSVMRSIKQALDPQNIMNPGKILRA
jgi:D-lactate dehydrogenase (cytochrome)